MVSRWQAREGGRRVRTFAEPLDEAVEKNNKNTREALQ
jgi:hypothetical protein